MTIRVLRRSMVLTMLLLATAAGGAIAQPWHKLDSDREAHRGSESARLVIGGTSFVPPGNDTLSFPNVTVGECSEDRYFIIDNTRSKEPVTVTVSKGGGSYIDWFDSPTFDGAVVQVGGYDTAFVPFRFCPKGTGDAVLDVVFWINGNLPQRRVLKGTGVAPELAAPSHADYFVLAPGCQLIPIGLVNLSKVQLAITSVTLDDPNAGFEIAPPDRTGMVIGANHYSAIGVRYCASGARNDHTILRIRYSGGVSSEVTVQLNGTAQAYGDSLYNLSGRQINFGAVPIGSCKRDSLVLTNTGSYTMSIGTSFFYPEPATPADTIFRLVAPALNGNPSAFAIDPGDSITLIYEYCPQIVGHDTATWIGMLRDVYPSGEAGVDLVGQGIELDTATITLDQHRQGRVGDPIPFTIYLHASAATRSLARWTSMTVWVDTTSLLLKRAYVPDMSGKLVDVTTVGPGIYAITAVNGTLPVIGDTIVTLEFVGLSTGVYDNRVHLRSIDIGGLTSVTVDSVGSILLIGCDVGRGLHLGLKGAIRSVVQQHNGPLLLRYHAPDGSAPTLTLVDARGTVLRSATLPAGTGTDMEAMFDFSDCAPGFYLLRLHAGDDVSSIPIMIIE